MVWKKKIGHYQLLNYNKALEYFKDFKQLPKSVKLNEYKNLNYNLAYD